MRRACSASPWTAAMPPTCWCRIRAICSTWRASRPRSPAPLMCSGLTGYGAIKKALPYLRAGPLLIVGLGGVGMMGLQFARALTDKPILVADIDAAKREAALKLGAAEAFDPADPGARKAIVQGVRRRRRRGGRFRRLRQVARVRARRRWPRAARRSSSACSAAASRMPVPMFPLRAITLMGSYVGSPAEAREMLDLVKAGKVAPIPVEKRPLERDQPLARRPARGQDRRPRRGHASVSGLGVGSRAADTTAQARSASARNAAAERSAGMKITVMGSAASGATSAPGLPRPATT